MIFGSSDLHIVVEPAMDCCRYVDEYSSMSRLFFKKPAAMSAVIVDFAAHVECSG